jgi:hypothetical protein
VVAGTVSPGWVEFAWTQRTVEWISWAVGFKARDNAVVANTTHPGVCMDAGLSLHRFVRPCPPLAAAWIVLALPSYPAMAPRSFSVNQGHLPQGAGMPPAKHDWKPGMWLKSILMSHKVLRPPANGVGQGL